MKHSALDQARENLRLQQVYNLFLRYGWELLFDRWPVLVGFHSRMQRWLWHLPDDLEPLSLPVKVRLMIEELGPTYVKMGQIISSQASVVPPEWEIELEKLQSDVPAFPSSQVREVIVEELGAPPEEIYASFAPEPFAAASTAQVHAATLDDGRKVAVKVQRPNIYNEMKADIGIMSDAVRVISRRSDDLKAIDLEGMVGQFGVSVLAELDYNGEAYNAFRLADSLSDIANVEVVEIYPTYSSSKVLTEGFVDGVKANDIEAIEAAGLDREALATAALQSMIKMMLIDGFFHADPHPGNILVDLESGQLTLIDTGMVGELDFTQRMNLIQLLAAVQNIDVQAMAEIMESLSTPFVDDFDQKAYYKDFERTIGRYTYGGRAIPFGEAINEAMDLLRRHGLRLDPNLTMAIKALMQAEAIATELYPEGGIVNQGVTIAKEMLVQEVTAEKIVDVASQQAMSTARELLKRVPSLQEATIGWLDQYQKGRFEVYVDTSDLAQEVDKLGVFLRQIVIGIVLMGMIIGSAIAVSGLTSVDPEIPYWLWMFRIAYFGFIGAMVIGFLMLARLVWRWMTGKNPMGD
ncbi:MAG: AarF/UbiB family protein [Chloroflexota bacterium]|nr:AarF/UbiB family protein [Chloroflexota bacterium]